MYAINPNGIKSGVIRLEDRACIPPSESNSDWQMYLKWAADGNIAGELPESPEEKKKREDDEVEIAAVRALIDRATILHAKSRTLSESNELIDILARLWIRAARKFNLIELIATTKRKD